MTTPRNTNIETNQPTHSPRFINTLAGLWTGTVCAGIFNPYDRALYLSVKENRPFLSSANFQKPFHGALQTCIQRSLIWGSYYIAQSEMKTTLYPYLRETHSLSESAAQLCVGLSAGSINGLIANPISAVKYHTWGKEDRNFFSSVKSMWHGNGIKPFTNGAVATVTRDNTYGGIYEATRTVLVKKISKDEIIKPNTQFICNLLASGIATIISSPLNYVRNIQYATPPKMKSDSIHHILFNLFTEAKAKPTYKASLSFLQQQCRIGWGTARVAVGMAVGQGIYDKSKEQLEYMTAKK